MQTKVKKFLYRIIYFFYFRIFERKWHGRLRYMFYRNNSKDLIVVFSGFTAGKPVYSYIRTLKNVKADKVFILDDFGSRGSYYLMENGTFLPRELCCELLEFVIKKGNYSTISMLGSSKGGTAALYYGLEFNATNVYAAANQYYIGNYLSSSFFTPVFTDMVGHTPTAEDVSRLNNVMREQLDLHKDSKTIIHLFYSQNEHTYQEHTIGLINDLKRNNIPFTETIENFSNHNDVGKYFSSFLKKNFNNIKRKNAVTF